MRGGASDCDDGPEAEMTLFEAMSDVKEASAGFQASLHPLGLSESRYWFLCPLDKEDRPGDPVLAIDCFAGLLWKTAVHGEPLLPGSIA